MLDVKSNVARSHETSSASRQTMSSLAQTQLSVSLSFNRRLISRDLTTYSRVDHGVRRPGHFDLGSTANHPRRIRSFDFHDLENRREI